MNPSSAASRPNPSVEARPNGKPPGPRGGLVIILLAGLAPYRRPRLTSNVRPQNTTPPMPDFGPPEHVYVENSWYDGPRAGVANVEGLPHRFVSLNDEEGDEYLGTFLVWPVDAAELQLEQEQWQIYVDWNEQYESGRVGSDSHPGHPGTDRRWDEIESILKERRDTIPANARRAKVEMVFIEQEKRYACSGPTYELRWRLL